MSDEQKPKIPEPTGRFELYLTGDAPTRYVNVCQVGWTQRGDIWLTLGEASPDAFVNARKTGQLEAPIVARFVMTEDTLWDLIDHLNEAEKNRKKPGPRIVFDGSTKN